MGSSRDPQLQRTVYQNINTTERIKIRAEESKTFQNRIADRITSFAGSMSCVLLHAFLFGGWIVINSGVIPVIKPFDPFPFVMLAMFASVEAIFLSTFILISQNRMAAVSEQRNELNLQITLLTEHEVTRLIALTDAIAKQLKVEVSGLSDLHELKEDVSYDKIIEEIEKRQ